MTAVDWERRDAEERAKFKQLQQFTAECRKYWPGSKIVIRASDSACVDLNSNIGSANIMTRTYLKIV